MSDVFDLIAALARLIASVTAAAASGDRARVDEILPATLRTSIVKAAADEEARQKFGS